MVLGYAAALKAIGSRDKRAGSPDGGIPRQQDNGEIAAELGRLALDMDRLDIAQQTLKVAEAQGVKDWKTLSAQGTLRAKQGKHAEAQQYYLAALEAKPDAVSVINNLALSYALDGKAEQVRGAAAQGGRQRQRRQPRAAEPRAWCSACKASSTRRDRSLRVDMSEQDAKSNMAYLRNMMSNPTQFAAASAGGADDAAAGGGATTATIGRRSAPRAAREPRRARARPPRKTPRQECKW